MSTKNGSWLVAAGLLAVFLLFTFVSPALLAQTYDPEAQRLLGLFQQVFTFVQNNYVDQVDSRVLIEGALKGMFESLEDPHSAYLTADDMRGLSDTTAGEFGGVGLYITKQPAREDAGRRRPAYVEVVAPMEGTPAFRAGILGGDLIIRIDGESTEELALDEVIKRLRGPAGSEVTVTVQRAERISFDVKLTRAIIHVPTVKFDMIAPDIGYVRIIQFTPRTAAKVQEAVDFFRNRRYGRLILDLRNNPGGLLTGVVEVADLFFDGGPIVSTKSRNPRENSEFLATPGVAVPSEVPLVVLIDGGSASASEILAGVFKDRGRATLLGTKTFGKGSVQQVRGLGESGFRLTMSRYYTPSGVTIDKVGVTPNREVKEPELTEAELAAYSELVANETIRNFVADRPAPTEEEIRRFVAELRGKNNVLSEALLRRLVRTEVNRHLTSPPVYDLQYDVVLREAVRTLGGRLP